MLARYTRYIALLTVPLIVIFVGNVMVGVGPSWSRLPGPYLVSADSRSIDPQSVDAASWTLSYLGSNNRIATDRVNGLIFGAGANQYPVAHVNSGVDVSPLLPFFVATTAASAGKKSTAVAVVKFRHLPYDTIAVVAQLIGAKWRVVSVVAAVDH